MVGISRDHIWPEQDVTALRQLWREGHSTPEIGRRLGKSKNAIVGKVHRLDLEARPSPIKRGSPNAPKPVRQPRAVPKLADMIPLTSCVSIPAVTPACSRPEPRLAQPRAERRELAVARNRTCCWPIGEPGKPGFRFCDQPALIAKPYCDDHAQVAYRRVRNRRDDPAADAELDEADHDDRAGAATLTEAA
jgi:GcrA cell cycle regulator